MSCHRGSDPQGKHPRSSALALLSGAAVTGGGGAGVRGRPRGAHHAPLPRRLSTSRWAKGRGSYSLPAWKGLSLHLLCVYLARSIYRVPAVCSGQVLWLALLGTRVPGAAPGQPTQHPLWPWHRPVRVGIRWLLPSRLTPPGLPVNCFHSSPRLRVRFWGPHTIDKTKSLLTSCQVSEYQPEAAEEPGGSRKLGKGGLAACGGGQPCRALAEAPASFEGVGDRCLSRQDTMAQGTPPGPLGEPALCKWKNRGRFCPGFGRPGRLELTGTLCLRFLICRMGQCLWWG